jgi:hypothetical protein
MRLGLKGGRRATFFYIKKSLVIATACLFHRLSSQEK